MRSRACLRPAASRTTPASACISARSSARAVPAASGGGAAVCQRRAARATSLFAQALGDAMCEHHRFQQRVRRQPIGAVCAGRGAFADGRRGHRAWCAPHMSVADAAHVIVRGRRDRDWLRRADRGPRSCRRRTRSGSAAGKCAPTASRASRKAPRPACAFKMDRARHHVARRQIGDERFALGVDDMCAFAAQRFGRERRGIAADVDGGGMELHELGIGDQRARRARPWRSLGPALAADWW